MISKPKYLIIPLIFIYLFTRFQHLLAIPVFGDEAIYLRWAQIIRNVETLRFIPLTDGKQPLFMWLTAATLKFNSDPLFVGRAVSIFSGLGIILGLFFLSSLVRNYHRSSLTFSSPDLVAPLIYTFLPFSFFFDRLALPDTLLSFFGLWVLIFSLLLAKYPRLDLAMILGGVLGLAWLTKSPAVYFLVFSFFTFIFLSRFRLSLLLYPLTSSLIAFFIYNLLRLGPQFHLIAIRNQDYIWPLSEIIRHPLDPLRPHLFAISRIFLQYISLLPFAILFFYLCQKVSLRRIDRLTFLLLGWFLIPVLSNATMAKVITGRYLLYTLPAFIILLSQAYLKLFPKPKILLLSVFLSFFFNFLWIYQISIHPFTATIANTESGYLSDWTSGWGIKEASDYLINRSKLANVIVGTEGYFGTLPDGLQIYTDGISRLTIFGVGLGFDTIPDKLIDAKNHGDEVYLLINRSRLKLSSEEIAKTKFIYRYPKPQNDELLLIQI
jgi:hypothetical protein